MSGSFKSERISLRDKVASIYQPKYSELTYRKWFANLVDNSLFDSDTIWSKGTGWTISGNTASSDGTQSADSLLSQTLEATIDILYTLGFDVASYSLGNVALEFDGSEVIADKAVNGSYTASAVSTSIDPVISAVADLDFVGDVDNVFVREAYRFPSSYLIMSVFQEGLLLDNDEYTIEDDGLVQTVVFTVEPNLNDKVAVDYRV